MEDLEIWKIVDLDFLSTGLLISSHGNSKRADFKDKKIGDNGAGYKLVKAHKIGLRADKKFYVHRLVAQKFLGTPKKVRLKSTTLTGTRAIITSVILSGLVLKRTLNTCTRMV